LQQKKETAMLQDTQIVLPCARLCSKNLQADFDGGTLSSDGGVLFFRKRLLLDSRVVELTKARHPIFVILSSSKPLFFKGLKVELRALGQIAA
jgi:hypothetical protein